MAKKIGIFLLLVGLLASVPQALVRIRVESASSHVELAADGKTFMELAAKEGVSLNMLFRSLRQAGFTTIGLPEVTLEELAGSGQGILLTPAEFRQLYQPAGWASVGGSAQSLAAQSAQSYVVAFDAQTASWLRERLVHRLGEAHVKPVTGLPLALRVMMPKADLQTLGLGFRDDQVQMAAQAGLLIAPRLTNTPRLGAFELRQLLEPVFRSGRASVLIMEGKQMAGYPDAIGGVVALLRRQGLTVGVIEKPDQLSNMDLAGMADYRLLAEDRMVRIFSIPDWLLSKRSPDEVTDAVLRAVQERNIRVIYARPLGKGIEASRELEGNLEHYAKMAAAVKDRGFQLGKALPFDPLEVPYLRRVLISLGIFGGGVLLATIVFPGSQRLWLASVLLAIPCTFVGYHVAPEAGRFAYGVLSAAIFPTLAGVVVLRTWQTGITENGGMAARPILLFPPLLIRGLQGLVTGSVSSLIGAFFIATLLGDRAHLLEWSYFRGVKLAFITPPVLVFLIGVLLTGFGAAGNERQGRASLSMGVRHLVDTGRWVMNQAVLFKQLVLIAAMMAIVVLYIIRSGNAAAGFISPTELEMRNALEHFLIARPRTKEFLIGHPAMVVAPLFAYLNSRAGFLILSMLAVMGQVSVVNSFEHLRTPLLVSLLRTFNGLWLGALIGAGLLWGVSLLWKHPFKGDSR